MAIVDIKHTQTIEELASKLGEGGSSGGRGALIIGWALNTTDGNFGVSLNATFAEIRAAMLAGRMVVINETPIEGIYERTAVEPVIQIKITERSDYSGFEVCTYSDQFTTHSEDGYPYADKS